MPELVLNGYGRANHWGGAISTYNINHGILLNGIAGMQYAWNYANRPIAPVLHNGSAYMMGGDLMGISDLTGIVLNRLSEEHPYAAMALGVVSIVATKGRAADDVFEAEKGLLLQASRKKGIIKADYLFENMNDAKNLSSKLLGPSKTRMYDETGKWIGWENKSGAQVYWKHGD